MAVTAGDETGTPTGSGPHQSSPSPDGVGGRDRRTEPVPRGWGNYFRIGNAAQKSRQLDRHVAWRLQRLLINKRSRNLRAGQAARWTEAWFHAQGLQEPMGTVGYPKAA